MRPGNGTDWIRAGTAVSLAASALCFAFRRRLPGRIALGFAVAFLERRRESLLAARVHELLAAAPSPQGGKA